MSRSLPAFVAVLGLLGLGLFWFLRPGPSQASGGSDSVARAEIAASPEDPGRIAESLRAVDARGAEAERQGLVPVESAWSGAPVEGPASIVTGPAPPAWILGRVVDEHGLGLEGAEIALSRGGPSSASDPPQARSDGEGRFELEVPPEVRSQFFGIALVVRAPGRATRRVPQSLPQPGQRLDVGEIELAPGALLAGRVVDAGGRGVPGAELRLIDADGGPFASMFIREEDPVAITDDAGRFGLDRAPIGPWSLRVDADELPPARFRGETTALDPRALDLRFELGRAASIAGAVTGLPSDGIADLVVVAERAEFVEVYERRVAPLDPGGAFRIDGLTPEEPYRLQLRDRGDAALDRGFAQLAEGLSEAVVTRAGETGVRLAYLEGSGLTLTVVDAETGAPVERLTFQMDRRFRTEVLAGPDPDDRRFFPGGVARFDGLRFDRDGGSARFGTQDLVGSDLQIESVGYRTRTLEFALPAPGELLDLGRIELEPVDVLEVRVLDAATQAPLEGARVTLAPARGARAGDDVSVSISVRFDSTTGEETIDTGDGRQTERTDAEGRARFSTFAAERFDLEVRAEGFAPHRARDLALSPSVPESVRMTRGGALEVTVVDTVGVPASGVAVEHRPGLGGDAGSSPWSLGAGLGGLSGGAAPRSDAAGRVRFEHLEPGPHRVRVGGEAPAVGFIMVGEQEGDDDWTVAEVAEGATARVTLVAPTTTTLTGRVFEAGVPLAGATVEVQRQGSGATGFPSFRGGPKGRTDGGGGYSIEGLEAGKVELVVTHPSRAMPTWIEAELVDAREVLDVDLSVALVRGRVVGSDGRPIEGATVSARRVVADESETTTTVVMGFGAGSMISLGGEPAAEAVRTGSDGRYELRGVTPGVELEVHARAPLTDEAHSEPFQVAPEGIEEGVDVTLEPAGALAVRVTDAEGKPAVGAAIVQLEFLGEGEASSRNQFVPASGEVDLDGLRPGPWSVALSTLGSGGANEVDRTEVEVLAGERGELTLVRP